MIDVRVHPSELTPEVLAVGVSSGGLLLDELPTQILPLAARAALDCFAADGATSAKAGDVCELPLPGELPARLLVAGLGDATPAALRRAGAALVRTARAGEFAVGIPGLDDDGVTALVEGLALGDHRFSAKSTADASAVRRVTFVCDVASTAIERGSTLAAATAWARDLTNTPSSTKTPSWLAQQAVQQLTPLGVRVEVRDEHWLADHGFGGVLAVGAGSASPVRLIEASWRPRGAGAQPHLVVVGKGITFDTGGLNLKPGAGMRSMHTDMGGGAAALGALRAIATLRLPVRITVLVPVAENAVSGSAMRPSDVIRHYGGRTSEVNNTDAEGRLVLADAMAYAVARLRPSVLVDLATLTGAMKVALGLRTAGFFATSDELADALCDAGERVDEPLWRMPFIEEYGPLLHSEVADAINSPGNPGAIGAALFLRPFAGSVPWAHLDIAGPARAGSDDGAVTKGATGFGTRLLVSWAESYLS